MQCANSTKKRPPDVFVFNPFAEGYIARGNAFTPVKHQSMLAEDLASLPQFLCEPHDFVLVPKQPNAGFLKVLEEAGFLTPEFVTLRDGKLEPSAAPFHSELGRLRPWAWGPDSVQLLRPLFGRAPGSGQYFNKDIAQLYSKAWSASFLRKVLAESPEPWLCSADEVGTAANTIEDALRVVTTIRNRGHHRVVAKAAHGLAGQNALRLWEAEILPAQRQWMVNVLESGGQLVVEPWLEREMDFSVQLEMTPGSLALCGYTGLINDLRGQYQGNWAEPNFRCNAPARVEKLLGTRANLSGVIESFYPRLISMLENELRLVGFVGAVSIDALVYRAPAGQCRLKPIVEINPRYTMGRVMVELMKHASAQCHGLFRLISKTRAQTEGSVDLADYARSLCERFPLSIKPDPTPKIREGAVCLNNPAEAQVCLATFQVSRDPQWSM